MSTGGAGSASGETQQPRPPPPKQQQRARPPQSPPPTSGLARSSTMYRSPVQSSPAALAAAVPSAVKTFLAGAAQCGGSGSRCGSVGAIVDGSSSFSPAGETSSLVAASVSTECCEDMSGVAPSPEGSPARGGDRAAAIEEAQGGGHHGEGVAVAVSPSKFAGAAALNVALVGGGATKNERTRPRPNKTSPRSVLDMDAALCGGGDARALDEDDDHDDDDELLGIGRGLPAPSPRLAGTKAAGGSERGSGSSTPVSVERDRDAELIRRFEGAFEDFLEQRRQRSRGTVASSSLGSDERLPSASEINELRDRLLGTASERARIEVELKSQLEEVERSKSEIESRLNKELVEARKAKDRSEAELKGQITRAVVAERTAAATAQQAGRAKSDGDDALRQRAAETKQQAPPPARHAQPPRPELAADRPSRSSPPSSMSRPAPRGTMIGMAPAARDAEGMTTLPRGGGDPRLRRRDHRLGDRPPHQIVGAFHNTSQWGCIERIEEESGEEAAAHRLRRHVPAALTPPSVSEVAAPTSIDWDDETITTVWAADSAIDDAMAELRASLPSPERAQSQPDPTTRLPPPPSS